MPSDNTTRAAAILGAADGLTIVVALVAGRNSDVFHSALDAGIGEFVGMAAALYLSAPVRKLWPAFICGLTTLVACVVPAIPYVALSHRTALWASAAVAAAVGAVVCWLRPEKGWLAVLETYGVILAAAGLCFLVSIL